MLPAILLLRILCLLVLFVLPLREEAFLGGVDEVDEGEGGVEFRTNSADRLRVLRLNGLDAGEDLEGVIVDAIS